MGSTGRGIRRHGPEQLSRPRHLAGGSDFHAHAAGQVQLQGTCHGFRSGATGGPLRYHRFPPLQWRTGTACRKIQRRARMPLPASMSHKSPALALLPPSWQNWDTSPHAGRQISCRRAHCAQTHPARLPADQRGAHPAKVIGLQDN